MAQDAGRLDPEVPRSSRIYRFRRLPDYGILSISSVGIRNLALGKK